MSASGAADPFTTGFRFEDLRHVADRAAFRAKAAGLAAGFALLALTTGIASAQQWQARTVANAELRYIDNVRLSVDDPESSFGSSLRAAAHAVRLTENSSLDLAAGLSSNTYSEASDLDSPAAFVQLNSSFRGERTGYRLGLSLNTQSTLTSETATTGLTQINKQQYQFAVNPGWNYRLTERASVDLGLSYTEVFYEDVNAIPLFNYRTGNLSAGGGYQLSERSGLDLRVSYGRYKADEVGTEYDNWAFQLGANYLLTEAWSVDFLFGLRRTEARFSDLSGSQVSQESTGPTYTVSLGRRFDRGGGINFRASRELVPSGNAEVLDTTALSFRLDYPFTERWRFGFDTTGYLNRQPDGDASLSDRRYIAGNLRLTYVFTRAWTVAGGYRYEWQNRDEVQGDAQSNAVFLTIAWNKNWDGG